MKKEREWLGLTSTYPAPSLCTMQICSFNEVIKHTLSDAMLSKTTEGASTKAQLPSNEI